MKPAEHGCNCAPDESGNIVHNSWAHDAQPTVHEIQTMSDLLKAAQATEDVDGLFDDLRTWIDLGIQLNAQPRNLKFNPKFIWKDDGARGLSGVRINIGGES